MGRVNLMERWVVDGQKNWSDLLSWASKQPRDLLLLSSPEFPRHGFVQNFVLEVGQGQVSSEQFVKLTIFLAKP